MKRILILVALLALAVAGCSSESPSEAVASEPEPTATPEQSSDAGESFDALPSFDDGAGDLASLLPTEVGGLTIQYTHSSGEEVFGSEGTSAEATAFLEALDAQPSDISSAFGIAFDIAASDPDAGRGISIIAIRVAGKDEATLRTAFIAATEASAGPVGEETTVGGKSVVVIASEGSTDGYLYVHDDVVYVVGGEPIELAEEALAALP